MALIDDMRLALRVTTTDFDSEINTLIEAARYDMERTGVNPALLAKEAETGNIANSFVKQAIAAYCKAHFGYDNPESEQLDAAYRRIVCDLLNSSENIAAKE